MPQELWRLYRKAMNAVVNGLTQQSADLVDTDPTVSDALVEMCRRSAAEGLVLLRNEGGVLPLAAGAEVAVFGRVQCDWFAVGYGSGGDVKPPYSVSLLEALREAGVAVSGELAAAYEAWSAANPPDEGYWGHWPRHFEEMPLDPGLVSRVANTAEVAVVVIGRAAGEDRENVLEEGLLLPHRRRARHAGRGRRTVRAGGGRGQHGQRDGPVLGGGVRGSSRGPGPRVAGRNGGVAGGGRRAHRGGVAVGAPDRHHRAPLRGLPHGGQLRRQGLQLLRRGRVRRLPLLRDVRPRHRAVPVRLRAVLCRVRVLDCRARGRRRGAGRRRGHQHRVASGA